jgi:hypothetical protein
VAAFSARTKGFGFKSRNYSGTSGLWLCEIARNISQNMMNADLLCFELGIPEEV